MEYLEKYLIEQLEDLKKENEKLKNDNKKLLEQLDGVKLNPVLGGRFGTSTYDWYIKKDNIEKYKQAMADKNFDWLESHEYRTNVYEYNYTLQLGKYSLLLNLEIDNNDQLRGGIVTCNNTYESLEQAREALLEQLQKDIAEKEKEYANQVEGAVK